MNDEQFERKMEFIVEQQGQFAVDIQQLKEAQLELTRQHNHLTGALTTVVSMVGDLSEAQARTTEQIAKLTNKQSETDDRLNVLIGVVERYFSGNAQRPESKSRQTKSSLNASAKRRSTKSSRKKRR